MEHARHCQTPGTTICPENCPVANVPSSDALCAGGVEPDSEGHPREPGSARERHRVDLRTVDARLFPAYVVQLAGNQF